MTAFPAPVWTSGRFATVAGSPAIPWCNRPGAGAITPQSGKRRSGPSWRGRAGRVYYSDQPVRVSALRLGERALRLGDVRGGRLGRRPIRGDRRVRLRARLPPSRGSCI